MTAASIALRLDRIHALVASAVRHVDPETGHTLRNALCILEDVKDDALRLEDRAEDADEKSAGRKGVPAGTPSSDAASQAAERAPNAPTHPTPPEGRETRSSVNVGGTCTLQPGRDSMRATVERIETRGA